MKSNSYLLSALLCLLSTSSFDATAQTKAQNFRASHADKVSKAWGYYQLFADRNAPEKTTVIKERVAAESIYELDGAATMTDSIKYSYSGTRGSIFNYAMMQFNFMVPYSNDPKYYPVDLGNVDVKADAVTEYKINPDQGTLELFCETESVLNSDGKIDNQLQSYYTSGQVDAADRYINTYDNQGKMTQLVLLTHTTQWDTFQKIKYSYNTAGARAADSIYEYGTGTGSLKRINVFDYDGNGKLSSITNKIENGGAWSVQTTTSFGFDPEGRLQEVAETGILDTRDSFFYAPGVSFPIGYSHYELPPGVGQWVLLYRSTKQLNAAGLPDTMLHENYYEGLSLIFKWVFQYNASNNPVRMDEYYETGSGFIPVRFFRYYYENYDATSVKELPKNAVQVYPNPVSNELAILFERADNTAITVDLINALGQVVYQEQTVLKERTLAINTQNLAAGSYWVYIRKQDGTRIFQTQVVKL